MGIPEHRRQDILDDTGGNAAVSRCCVASHAHADHMTAAMHSELLEKNGIFVVQPGSGDSIVLAAGDA